MLTDPNAPRYDPALKTELRNRLHDRLYGVPLRILDDRLTELVMRNCAIHNYAHKHFVYKGVVYNKDVTTPPLPRNQLSQGLKPEMETWLREMDQLQRKEMPHVLSAVMKVLNSSDSLADFLELLPESLHEPLHEMQAKCPCEHRSLNDDQIQALRAELGEGLLKLRERLMMNTLL